MTIQLDGNTQQALAMFLQGMFKSSGPGAMNIPGVALRNDIGDPATSPDPAFFFAPHGTDSVRVYWNEQVQPLAAWLPVESDDALEKTTEFISYLVPNVSADGIGVVDGNVPCANCGQPNCATGPYGTSICESFGKTATFGPIYRYNTHMGRIMTSSNTREWLIAKARQNRGFLKPINLKSIIDGRNITLSSRKEIFAYMAHYEWVKEFGWSLWGGAGYNGSFPGILEVVRPGWARENEYRVDNTGIPDNVVLDPMTISFAGVPYYDHPWLIAERVQQVVNELTRRATAPAIGTVGGVPNVLMDMALVASPEWITFFAKLVAKIGMANDYNIMPNPFSVTINPTETDARFAAMTNGALGWGYIPTPAGMLPFLPDFSCDPSKLPAGACQRPADECDTADTYSTTMRLLVRRAGNQNLLGIRYLNLNQTIDSDHMMPGDDYVLGDSGRWANVFTESTNGLCERASQIGYAGLFNDAPTVQTIFTDASYRSYLAPQRPNPGSAYFQGGANLKTIQTADRNLINTNPVSVTGQVTSISGGNGVYKIIASELNGLGNVPVGTKFTSGSYVGHVASYSDADNSIRVYGDLSGVLATSYFTLGEAVACADCGDSETLTVLTAADACVPIRTAYSGVIQAVTSGYIIGITSAVISALGADALLGGHVYVAGAEIGQVIAQTSATPAVIKLNLPTSAPLAVGDAITIYKDSGCESDDPDMEALYAYVVLPAHIPLTNTDTAYITFVSKTGATTTVAAVAGYPQPTGYVSQSALAGMLATVLASNASSGGVEVYTDFLYQSVQVPGVFARIRIPYLKA